MTLSTAGLFSFNFLVKKFASAGNRTRINCLEGSYADHYTTDAGSGGMTVHDQGAELGVSVESKVQGLAPLAPVTCKLSCIKSTKSTICSAY